MKRFLVFLLSGLLCMPPNAWAQQRRDGDTTPVKPNFTPIGGTDGTTDRIGRFDTNGIFRIREEFPASGSAPVIFDMASAVSQANVTAITDLGIAYSGAGDFYNEAIIFSVAASTLPIHVFLKASTDGTNFDLVYGMRDSLGTTVPDTLSWTVFSTAATGLGRGAWLAIPTEYQAAVNAAQHIRLAVRQPNSAAVVLSARYVGKR